QRQHMQVDRHREHLPRATIHHHRESLVGAVDDNVANAAVDLDLVVHVITPALPPVITKSRRTTKIAKNHLVQNRDDLVAAPPRWVLRDPSCLRDQAYRKKPPVARLSHSVTLRRAALRCATLRHARRSSSVVPFGRPPLTRRQRLATA